MAFQSRTLRPWKAIVQIDLLRFDAISPLVSGSAISHATAPRLGSFGVGFIGLKTMPPVRVYQKRTTSKLAL
jgi:hypothetical protein